MNRTDRFDEIVSDWLHADAEYRVPQHLDAVLRRTRIGATATGMVEPRKVAPHVRDTSSQPSSQARRSSGRAGPGRRGDRRRDPGRGLAPASRRPVRPHAQRSDRLWGDRRRHPCGIDPVTQRSTAIDHEPGLRLRTVIRARWFPAQFVRAEQRSGPFVLMLAGADGSSPRALSKALTALSWFAWSPDGSRLAVISDSRR